MGVGESEPSTLAAGPGAFHLLAKPTGAVCNLDCARAVVAALLEPMARARRFVGT